MNGYFENFLKQSNVPVENELRFRRTFSFLFKKHHSKMALLFGQNQPPPISTTYAHNNKFNITGNFVGLFDFKLFQNDK